MRASQVVSIPLVDSDVTGFVNDDEASFCHFGYFALDSSSKVSSCSSSSSSSLHMAAWLPACQVAIILLGAQLCH